MNQIQNIFIVSIYIKRIKSYFKNCGSFLDPRKPIKLFDILVISHWSWIYIQGSNNEMLGEMPTRISDS